MLGIFEASVIQSLKLLKDGENYGIVSTGKYWRKSLSEGIKSMNVKGAEDKFAGVETTGLNAKELHDRPTEEVNDKLKDATKRLLKENKVGAICLGCAGMAGLDRVVREACEEEFGSARGKEVDIVDGTLAAVGLISQGEGKEC